jgi:hypothetical protein
MFIYDELLKDAAAIIVACQIIWQLVNDRLERIMEGISHALI